MDSRYQILEALKGLKAVVSTNEARQKYPPDKVRKLANLIDKAIASFEAADGEFRNLLSQVTLSAIALGLKFGF